jgi:hypothetical protein
MVQCVLASKLLQSPLEPAAVPFGIILALCLLPLSPASGKVYIFSRPELGFMCNLPPNDIENENCSTKIFQDERLRLEVGNESIVTWWWSSVFIKLQLFKFRIAYH